MPAATPVTSAGPGTGRAERRGWWPLAVIASAHLMAILDTTVMFVALPSAQHALGMSASQRQWVVTAYTLALAGLLLLGGRLADRFGARRTLIAGVAGFALASAVGGAAQDAAMLIAARAVQGAFGAVLVSSTKSLLVTVYTDEDERTRAIGVFTATLTAGFSVGLLLGGALTTALGWRWCLYVNVALSALPLAAAPRVLPQLPPRRTVSIDVISAVLATAGMAGLVYGLGEAASYGWDSVQVDVSLAVAAAALGWFTARQAGHSDRLLPLRVVLDRNRGWGLAGLVVNSLSTFGMMLILTYQLQSVMHYSALRTGLALIPFGVAAALGSAVLAPALTRQIPPRWLVSGSILVEAAGLLSLAWLTPGSGYLPLILTATLIEGLSTGVAGPVTLALSLRGVLPADTGAAGAATSATSQLGSSVGAALLNTIAASAAAGYAIAHAAGTASAAALATSATVHGFTVAMIWGTAILAATAVPVAIFINAPKPARPRNR